MKAEPEGIALNGQEVTEQEADARRQVRERSDEMWQSHEAEQQRQYLTGLDKLLPVTGSLKLKKPSDQA